MPVALYAFILVPTWGPILIEADSLCSEFPCRGKIKVRGILHFIMEESEEEDDSSDVPKYTWFWLLCFLFPPLFVLAVPFWLVRMVRDSEPPPEPWTAPLEIPPPVKRPAPRPRPEYDVFPTKSDYSGPEIRWWDVDDVPVGTEYNRPEDEWWELSE